MPLGSEKRNPAVIAVASVVLSVAAFSTFARGHAEMWRWPLVFSEAVASCFGGGAAFLGSNALRSARALFAIAALFLTSWSLGGVVGTRIPGVRSSFARLGVGMIVLHFVLFLLAAMQLWSRPLLVAIAAAGTVAGSISVWRAGDQFLSGFRNGWAIGAASVFLAITAIENFGPEMGADAGLYHVGVPTFWLLEGGMAPIRDHFLSNLPLPQSMFYGFLIALGPSDATRLFPPAMMLFATLVLARGVFAKSAPIAVWGVLAVPALTGYLAISGSDHLAIAFFALGLSFGLAPRPQGSLALACAFFGFALTAKYTMAIQVGLAVFYVFWRARPLDRRALFWPAVLLVAPSLVWAAKALVFTGNPIFPFLGETHAPATIRNIAANRSIVRSFADLLRFPLTTAFTPGYMHNAGPQWAVLAPIAFAFAWLDKTRRKETLLITALLAAGWLQWALIYENARYSGPLFLATAIAAGSAISHKTAKAAVLGLLCATALATWAYRLQLLRPYTYVCGGFDPIGYATKQDLPMTVAPPHAMFAWLNANLDRRRDRVLLIGESRTAGLEVRHVSGTELDHPIHAPYVEGARSAEEVLARLRAAGVTHVAINRMMAAYFERHDYGVLRVSPEAARLWDEVIESSRAIAREQDARSDWVVVELRDPA